MKEIKGNERKLKESKDFIEKVIQNTKMKDRLYNRICEAYIFKYRAGIDGGIDDVVVDEEVINEIASEVNLIKNVHMLAGQLSHGQKQWLEIGMLLAQKPNLLLVDEPAAGMTAPERQKTVSLLKNLSKNQSVIVVEHDMEFIKSLDCRVTVLHDGTVLAEGSLEHVSKNNKVIDVYLGR